MSSEMDYGSGDDEAQTPQSSPVAPHRTFLLAGPASPSVDNVADLIERKKALEESEESDNDAADTADIYAQFKQRLMGGAASKAAASDAAIVPTAARQAGSPSPARSRRAISRPSARSSPSKSASAGSESDSDVPVVTRKRIRQSQLFQAESSGSSASELERSASPEKTDRLQQLIMRRRQERERKAEEEAARKSEAAKQAFPDPRPAHLSDDIEPDMEETVADPAAEDAMTQQSRPTRKASKKAIEEMNKETQRINRNMQLTHQAKVKTKFSVADFAARFSRPAAVQQEAAQPAPSSSVHGSSDNEADAVQDTPPSSPPSESGGLDLGKSILGAVPEAAPEDEELPTMEEIITQCLTKVDKGKAPAPRSPSPAPIAKTKISPRKYLIKHRQPPTKTDTVDLSDEDLEVAQTHLSIFDTVKPSKAQESRADLHLRFLAGMNNHESTGRNKHARPKMTAAQMDAQLLHRAALQSKQEQEKKIAELLAKGIVVQTAEEREKDQLEIENMLEKARQEAAELRKKEKEQEKEEKGEMGLDASSDESDDEEWMEGKEESDAEEADAEEEEEEDVELSGSEDEEEDEEEDVDDERPGNALIDGTAEEDEDEVDEEDSAAEIELTDTEDAPNAAQPKRRLGMKKFIVEDDEDDEEAVEAVASTPAITATPAPARQASEDDEEANDIAAAFGFNMGAQALISPSQLFAGTMGASQSQGDTQPFTQEQDSMALFNQPSPRQATPLPREDYADRLSTPSAAKMDFSQSLQTPAMIGFSQESSIPTPSQDMGFGHFPSQMRRELSVSAQSMADTQETVLMPVPESPIVQRKGRLQRRKIADDDSGDEADEPVKTALKDKTAFDVLRKAANKPAMSDFNKKKSDAKNMVDEQAEESEDEYAGLGGASDDESDGEADELTKAMIDESDVSVDERQNAALYAEKSRLENEAQTSKLYKDLMSGALRRQRGDAFDLDSDEDEQLAERRRRKQREETRKRRLLLGDEKLGALGNNEKKEAFLRAIEDRDEAIDEEVDLLDGQGSQNDFVPNSQPLEEVSANAAPPKRKAEAEFDGPFKRPRRPVANAAFVKPSSLADVRESVSFLVDDAHAPVRPVEEEMEDAPVPERQHFSARRTPAPVVDRLLLRKTSSTASSSGGLAFLSRASTTTSLFRASMLSRTASNASSGSGRKAIESKEGSRPSGSKKSSIAYAAREAERKAVLDGVEKRRREDVKRIAGMRTGGLGAWGGGGFE